MTLTALVDLLPESQSQAIVAGYTNAASHLEAFFAAVIQFGHNHGQSSLCISVATGLRIISIGSTIKFDPSMALPVAETSHPDRPLGAHSVRHGECMSETCSKGASQGLHTLCPQPFAKSMLICVIIAPWMCQWQLVGSLRHKSPRRWYRTRRKPLSSILQKLQ